MDANRGELKTIYWRNLGVERRSSKEVAAISNFGQQRYTIGEVCFTLFTMPLLDYDVVIKMAFER